MRLHLIGKTCAFLITIMMLGCIYQTKSSQSWVLSPEGATSFSLSREGRFALVASNQQGILLWDLDKDTRLADFGYQDPQKNAVTTSNISDNGRYAITATSTNFAVWDLAKGMSEGLWSVEETIIHRACISNNGQKILLALDNNKALFIDLGTGRRLEFLAHQNKVNSVALSPNGKYALSGGDDHMAYFWNTETGQILQKFTHVQRVTRVALHRKADYAFSASSDDTAVIWDLKSGDTVSSLDIFYRFTNYSAARFSDDGQQLITGSPSRAVEYWNTQTGENIGRWLVEVQQNRRPTSAVVYDVAQDKQGRVISASSAGIAQAWAVEPF